MLVGRGLEGHTLLFGGVDGLRSIVRGIALGLAAISVLPEIGVRSLLSWGVEVGKLVSLYYLDYW